MVFGESFSLCLCLRWLVNSVVCLGIRALKAAAVRSRATLCVILRDVASYAFTLAWCGQPDGGGIDGRQAAFSPETYPKRVGAISAVGACCDWLGRPRMFCAVIVGGTPTSRQLQFFAAAVNQAPNPGLLARR